MKKNLSKLNVAYILKYNVFFLAKKEMSKISNLLYFKFLCQIISRVFVIT